MVFGWLFFELESQKNEIRNKVTTSLTSIQKAYVIPM